MTENIFYVLRCTIDQETWGNYQSTSSAARNNIFILRSKINVTANENLLYIISFFDLVKSQGGLFSLERFLLSQNALRNLL